MFMLLSGLRGLWGLWSEAPFLLGGPGSIILSGFGRVLSSGFFLVLRGLLVVCPMALAFP
jgi:hypothetical protein